MDNPISFLKTPPTDSLYKFMAISGFIVMLTTGLFYQYMNYKIFKVENSNYTDSIITYKRLDELSSISRRMSYIIPMMDSICQSNKILSQNYPKFIRLYNRFDSLMNVSALKRKEYEEIDKIYQMGFAEKHYLNDLQTKYRDTLAFLFSISSIITLAGFILWYVKIQRHQDIIIQAEAERSIKLIKQENLKNNINKEKTLSKTTTITKIANILLPIALLILFFLCYWLILRLIFEIHL